MTQTTTTTEAEETENERSSRNQHKQWSQLSHNCDQIPVILDKHRSPVRRLQHLQSGIAEIDRLFGRNAGNINARQVRVLI